MCEGRVDTLSHRASGPAVQLNQRLPRSYRLVPSHLSWFTCQQRLSAVIRDNVSHIEVWPETDSQLAYNLLDAGIPDH
jgi:hypothetical protein